MAAISSFSAERSSTVSVAIGFGGGWEAVKSLIPDLTVAASLSACRWGILILTQRKIRQTDRFVPTLSQLAEDAVDFGPGRQVSGDGLSGGVGERGVRRGFRRVFEGVDICPLKDRAAQFGVRRYEFREQQSAAKSSAGARFAPRVAIRAAAANEPLIRDAAQSAREQIGFDTHIEQSPDHAAGGAGVQRAEDEMAGEGRFDADARGFAIANLADHEDFGILPEQAAHAAGEVELGAGASLRLADAFDDLFDGIFERDDMSPCRDEMAEAGVNGRRFAAAAGAGEKNRAGAFFE